VFLPVFVVRTRGNGEQQHKYILVNRFCNSTLSCCFIMTTDYIIFLLDCVMYFFFFLIIVMYYLFHKIIVSEECVFLT
jgi:hypothetical protein